MLQIFGETLEIDRVAYYSDLVLADEADTATDALANGTAAGIKISLRPLDGIPCISYSPEALEAAGRTTVITESWNSEGLSEHAGFA